MTNAATEAALSAIQTRRNETSFVASTPYTPKDLLNEMVDKVDDNTDASVLVMFTVEFVPVLLERGYTDITVTTDKYCIKTEQICNTFGVTYTLMDDIDMKFDVVIGNPPYQNPKSGNDNTNQGGGKKLYVQFMEKSSKVVKDGGTIALVVPSAVFKTTKFGQMGKGFSSMQGCKLLLGETDVSHHFNVGITISYFIAKKTDQKVYTKINGREVDFENTGYHAVDTELQSIAEKLLTKKDNITIKRDKDLEGSGITTSRFAYLTFDNTPEDTNLAWSYDKPDLLKRLLKSNLFCRVAWDGFVILDKRWYHHFWSALDVHQDLTVDMSDDEIMDLYGLTQSEKDIINKKDRTNVVK